MSQLATIQLNAIALSDTTAQVARRKGFDKGQLAELADSIRTHGVLQPIVVRYTDNGLPMYELVAGERRFLAAQLAELEDIHAVVRELTDEQVVEVQLIENLQRAEIHPMEEAEGYQQLMSEYGHPIEELHSRVGKSRSYVYGRLKLLALCKKAREAFYAGELSASVALLIARIPSDKLQESALFGVVEDSMSARDAGQWIQSEFMLRLKDAPFPTDDQTLNGKAGPCSTCPKRTGNQPELFGDVQGADVCTDPECYRGKVIAFGNRALTEARERGQTTITGAKAEQVAPRGIGDARYPASLRGWHRLTDKNWNVGKTIKQIVGKDAERALLRCPLTCVVVEVVSDAEVKKALKAKRKSTSAAPDPHRAAQQKAKLERKFRRELYTRLRPLLPAPTLQAIATTMFGRLHHETLKVLCDVRGFEPPVRTYYGNKSKDYTAVAKGVEAWTDAAAQELINDMIYVSELNVGTYSTGKPERLLEAAKAAGFDAAAVRREVTPAKKPAKKKPAAKKKRATKKPARKKVGKRGIIL